MKNYFKTSAVLALSFFATAYITNNKNTSVDCKEICNCITVIITCSLAIHWFIDALNEPENK